VLHGPRLSPMNAKSLCTFRFWLPLCGLPYCLIGLATGRTGAAHAAPAYASSRTTSITLHSRLWAGLHAVRLKKKHVLRWGKPLGSQAPSPNHQRHAQPCNQVLGLKAQQPGSERTPSSGYSSTIPSEQMPSKQPATLARRLPCHKLLLLYRSLSASGDGAEECLEGSTRP
jgi:hypothetical protein